MFLPKEAKRPGVGGREWGVGVGRVGGVWHIVFRIPCLEQSGVSSSGDCGCDAEPSPLALFFADLGRMMDSDETRGRGPM